MFGNDDYLMMRDVKLNALFDQSRAKKKPICHKNLALILNEKGIEVYCLLSVTTC